MSAEGTEPVLDFLKEVPLFRNLRQEDLEALGARARQISVAAGAALFSQGDAGDYAYVIEKGDVEISRVSDGREVPLAIRRRGEIVGEMALLEKTPRMAGARALTDGVLLVIGGEDLERLFSASPGAARAILATVTARLRETQALLMQSEKMAQLGTFTAGMAHELNNPASAVLRGAAHLRDVIRDFSSAGIALGRAGLPAALSEELARRVSEARTDSSPQESRGGRLDEIEAWMETRRFDDAIRYAPDFADIGYTREALEAMAALYPRQALPHALVLVAAAHAAQSLLGEISLGTRRIADVVAALKSYIYLDQGPEQNVDIHEGLESTLVILRHKLTPGIRVRRDFAQGLPRVPAHGSALNQVWTNLIDNAADALQGKGEIVVRTRYDGSVVKVEVQDNGPGIPDEIKPRVFSLFFTTKPLGKGTGQGLNIAYGIVRRHGGDIGFTSEPGKTVFTVRIPTGPRRSTAAEEALRET